MALKENKILITGMGRSGTSVLMALLTRYGFDTGFNEDDIKEIYNMEYHCGLEDFNRDAYFIKRPACNDVQHMFDKYNYDLIIITVRPTQDTVKSRERCHELGFKQGGLSRDNKEKLSQYNYNAKVFGELVAETILRDIPCLFLKFPEFVLDFDYFWNQINRVLIMPEGLNKSRAMDIYNKTVDSKLIHF